MDPYNYWLRLLEGMGNMSGTALAFHPPLSEVRYM